MYFSIFSNLFIYFVVVCVCVCSFLCSDSLLYTSFFFLFYMVFIHLIVHDILDIDHDNLGVDHDNLGVDHDILGIDHDILGPCLIDTDRPFFLHTPLPPTHTQRQCAHLEEGTRRPDGTLSASLHRCGHRGLLSCGDRVDAKSTTSDSYMPPQPRVAKTIGWCHSLYFPLRVVSDLICSSLSPCISFSG